MRSEFLMQIVDRTTGEVVRFEAGGRIETDLKADILARVSQQPTGVFRTEASVRQVVSDAVDAAFRALKRTVRPTI